MKRKLNDIFVYLKSYLTLFNTSFTTTKKNSKNSQHAHINSYHYFNWKIQITTLDISNIRYVTKSIKTYLILKNI